MDFEELIYGMNRVVFRLSRSVSYKKASVLQRDELLEWSSYVVTAGDEIIDSILCSTVDITRTIASLRTKYKKASKLANRMNPSNPTRIFDVYVIVLDEIESYILEQEAKTYGY